MDKATWLLLDEPERIDQLRQWITRLLELEEMVPIEIKEVEEKRAIEKIIFNVLEWMKDYE